MISLLIIFLAAMFVDGVCRATEQNRVISPKYVRGGSVITVSNNNGSAHAQHPFQCVLNIINSTRFRYKYVLFGMNYRVNIGCGESGNKEAVFFTSNE